MIDTISRGLLGKVGSAILDFYIENALWINGLVLAYALIVVLANYARQQIEGEIKQYFNKIYGQNLMNKGEAWFKKTLEHNRLDWEALARSTWIPIVSKNHSIGLRFKSTGSLEEIFTPDYISTLFADEEE